MQKYSVRFKAQARVNRDPREEELVKKLPFFSRRDLRTWGTLIFILVPPQANSAGYLNNLQGFFILALCTVPTEQRYSGPPVTSHMQTKGLETLWRTGNVDRMWEENVPRVFLFSKSSGSDTSGVFLLIIKRIFFVLSIPVVVTWGNFPLYLS